MMQPQTQQLQEGARRTSRRTGEVQVLQNGQWVSQGGAAPPSYTPQPVTVRPASPVQERRVNLDLENTEGAIEERRRSSARADQSQEDTNYQQGFGRVGSLRTEFESSPIVKNFPALERSYRGLRALSEQGTPSSDMAMVFGFMKMLDETSVVREAEQDQARNATDLRGRIENYYNRMATGQSLNPTQRADMLAAAQELYGIAAEIHNRRAGRYRSLMSEQGVPEGRLGTHVPMVPLLSGGQMGGYIDDTITERPMTANPTGPEPAAAPLGGSMERPVTARGADPEQIVTGARSHDTPEIHEQRLAALQRFNYGLLRGVPDEQLIEQLRGSLDFDPMTAENNIGALLEERRRLGNREFRNRNRNLGVNPRSYTLEPPDISDARSAEGSLGETLDATFRGATDTASLGFSDEIVAGGEALANGAGYDDTLRRERAISDFDSNNNPISRLLGQAGGGFLLPVGRARTAGQLSGVAAGYGGAYGLGSGDGSVLERLQSAGGGAAMGGAAGFALGRAGELIQGRLATRAPRLNPDGSNPADIALAAERQSIDLPSPDVLQGRRGAYSFLESMPGAGGRIRNDVGAANQALEQRVAAVGGQSSSNRQEAGEVIRGAAERYIGTSRDAVGRLYSRAEQLSGGAQVQGTNALASIDRNIAELAPTAAASPAKTALLQRLRSVLVDPDTGAPVPLSIQSIRNLRTDMRDEIAAQGLRFSDADRRVMGVIDDLNADIRAQLSGPALRAFDRADSAHRERIQTIDSVVQRFIGTRNSPRSSEQIMGAVESMSRPTGGNADALRRMASGLTPGERSEVAGHIASQLGRQDAEGVATFSPIRFFTQIQGYSREARQAIWGRRGAEDIADLATLAQARGGTTAGMNNSRSGVVQNWRDSLAGLFGLGAGYGVGGTMGSIATAGALGAGYVTARALGNPEVVRALAIAARGGPQTRNNVIQLLGRAAAREPALAPDISIITRALDSGARSAAAEDTQNPR